MLAFISSPYSHPDTTTQDARALAAGDFAAWLWRKGIIMPISPIAHWHEIGQRNHLPGNAMAWLEWNKTVLKKADMLYVLCLPGWRDSQGVAYEIQWSIDAEIPIFYAVPSGATYHVSIHPPGA